MRTRLDRWGLGRERSLRPKAAISSRWRAPGSIGGASEGMGAGDFVWATFPRPHAATPSPISNPFGTYMHWWPGLVAQIVAAALTAG